MLRAGILTRKGLTVNADFPGHLENLRRLIWRSRRLGYQFNPPQQIDFSTKGTHMKPLLAGLALALLVSCAAMQQQAITTLTDDAKAACTQQAVFNTVAGAAGVFGPQAAAAAAVASAVVGVACTWINGR